MTAIVHGARRPRGAGAAGAAFGGGGAGGGQSAADVTLDGRAAQAGLKIVDVIAEAGLAASKSAARRLIEQGGVRLGERKVASVDDVLDQGEVGEARASCLAPSKRAACAA